MIRLALAALLLAPALAAAQPEGAPASEVKIKPKASRARAERSGSLAPDVDVVDAPTTAVLDYGGYSTRSRFYSNGGILEYVSFGVYPGINLGASATVDGLIGDEKHVRMRAPQAQVKWRVYEGDAELPSVAIGYDGQGYRYNTAIKRYNQRQRGFYLGFTKEIGVPGFQVHPSMNVSDFDSNGIFGSIPLTLNIRDKVAILAEWDNINNFADSRLNAGLRAYVTPGFHVDFAVRAIGAGGHYGDGARKGAERIVQLKYSANC